MSGGDHESEATFGHVRPFGELDPGDEGRTHYFRSGTCRAAFERDPRAHAGG